jgi:hypothetical protein
VLVRPANPTRRSRASRRRSMTPLGSRSTTVSTAQEIQAPHTGDVVQITPIPYGRLQVVRRLITSSST